MYITYSLYISHTATMHAIILVVYGSAVWLAAVVQ